MDFLLNTKYRNPFCDPAEVDNIKKAKNSEQYETLYQEYYAQKESNHTMRFAGEVLSDAEKIYEDTCVPDSFRLEMQTGAYTQPDYISLEDAGFFVQEPADGWFAKVTKVKGKGTVMVERRIRIADTSGRTNNGYFDLKVQQGGTFAVAEDAIITMGEAGEAPATLTKAEWLAWLAGDAAEQGGSFTLFFGADAEGKPVIVEAREGHWVAEEIEPAELFSIPFGYPTKSKTISAPFTMQDEKIVHSGVDFSLDGRSIPVYATADGIHCHYEVLRSGTAQDPAQYF